MTPRPALWLALLGVIAAATLPVLTSHHLPLQDWPQHLLMATVLAQPADPGFAAHYTTDLRLRPYLGYYGLAWLFGSLLTPDATGRACLLLYLLATPAAVLAYTRAVAPARTAAIPVVVPALFSGVYYLGLLNLLLAIPAVFAGLACFISLIARPRAALVIGFALAAASVYLCHALAFGLLVLVAAIHALLATGGGRKRGLLAIAALVLLALLVTPRQGLSELPFAIGYRAFGTTAQPAPDVGFQFLSPLISVTHLLGTMVVDRALMDLLAWTLVAAALLASWWLARQLPTVADPPGLGPRWPLPASALALVFLAPDNAKQIWWVNVHFAPFVLLSLPTLIPARLLDGRTRIALTLAAWVAVAGALGVHQRFDGEARELDELMPLVRCDSLLAPLILDPFSAATLWTSPYQQAGCLVHATRGGYGTELFEGPQIPVRLLPGHGLGGMHRHGSRPREIAARLPALAPDYILGRGAAAAGLVPAGYRLVFTGPTFRLWERASP